MGIPISHPVAMPQTARKTLRVRAERQTSPGSAPGVRISAVMAALIWASSTSAQIVNVLDRVAAPGERISGSLSASLEWRTGNPDLLQGGLSGDLRYGSPGYAVFLIANGELGRKDGQKYLARHFEHLRLRVPVSATLSPEGFFQLAHDEFRRLSLRTLGGAGIRVQLAGGDRGFLAVGASYMAEREKIAGTGANSPETISSHRNSTYVHASYSPRKDLSLHGTCFVQPVLSDPHDVRSMADLTLRIGSGAFFVQNSFHVEYDTRSPADVDDLQTRIASSLGVQL